jgi:hypothetical protein
VLSTLRALPLPPEVRRPGLLAGGAAPGVGNDAREGISQHLARIVLANGTGGATISHLLSCQPPHELSPEASPGEAVTGGDESVDARLRGSGSLSIGL